MRWVSPHEIVSMRISRKREARMPSAERPTYWKEKRTYCTAKRMYYKQKFCQKSADR